MKQINEATNEAEISEYLVGMPLMDLVGSMDTPGDQLQMAKETLHAIELYGWPSLQAAAVVRSFFHKFEAQGKLFAQARRR